MFSLQSSKQHFQACATNSAEITALSPSALAQQVHIITKSVMVLVVPWFSAVILDDFFTHTFALRNSS